MDLDQIIDRCIEQMKAKNLTNRDVANLANISEATVSRLLRSHGANATAASLLAVCNALEPEIAPDNERDTREEKSGTDELYAARIEDLKASICVKNKWIKTLFAVCIVLIIVILFLLFLDALQPGTGWLRQ